MIDVFTLRWLERNAIEIHIQPIAPGRRAKNRVICRYRVNGTERVIGGRTLREIAWKAIARDTAKPTCAPNKTFSLGNVSVCRDAETEGNHDQAA